MRSRRTFGFRAFTLLEALLVTAVLALLLAVFLPALAKPRARVKKISCVNCLKQVGLGFRIWAGDNGDRFPVQLSVTNGGTMELVPGGAAFPHFQVLSNELNTPKVLVCPEDRGRRPATTFVTGFDDSHLSYFVGLDAQDGQPQAFLSGDSNLEVDGKPVRPGLLVLATNSAAGWTAARHAYGGNVAFADGSVQAFNSAGLRAALARTSAATNRLAVP